MANVNLWSSVGSAGTVNPPDLGKVVLAGSIAQLGATGGVVSASPQVAAARTGRGTGAGPGTQAVIRYGVAAIDAGFNPIPNVGLGMVCRTGNGQVAARLVQVSIVFSKPLPGVVETTLIELQAQPANLFSAQVTFSSSPTLDFQANVYYVEVTLSAAGDVVPTNPPAISTLQLLYNQPAGGGGGGGSGGSSGGGTHHKFSKKRRAG
jgi:hypothetical protein